MRTLLVALLALALAGAVEARTFFWKSLEVEAELLDDGRLHVVERQWMVFDGAWNGGERIFNVGPGQSLELHGMRRIDPESGETIEMRKGSLSRVDAYDWHDRDTLRWRSRLESDPPFDSAEILYEIEYTATGVVQQREDEFWMDHDFAFADRESAIEEFSLELEIDAAWAALPIPGVEREPSVGGERIRFEQADIRPGIGVPLHFSLERRAESRPAAVRGTLSRFVRAAIVASVLLAIGGLLFRLFTHESDQGRFAPPDAPTSLDRTWLEENLLSIRAEVIGSIWDHKIGPQEVAALLARLVAEGRLASSVRQEGRWFKRQVLELELVSDRDAFDDYERRLIDRLFFDRRTKTDIEAIRKRYSSTGFSPATHIRSGINKIRGKLPGFSSRLPKASPRPSLLLALGGVALLGLEALSRGFGTAGPAAAIVVVAFLPSLVFGYALARAYLHRSDRLGLRAATFLLPLAVTGWAILWVIWAGGRSFVGDIAYIGFFGCAGMTLLYLALLNSVLNAARTRDRRDAVALRKRLVQTRKTLRRELGKPEPALDDAWLPYLLAFGLEKKVERWFRAFGGATGAVSHRPRSGGSWSAEGGTSSGSRGWTGGGGAFGGAGATASWAAAAGTMSHGIARPSSGGGSSGGGGGGGGSSSGGGGGGGW